MKIIFLLSTLVLLAVCTSCNKENVIKNNGIYGKWQYKEVYDGYFNGGNFTWTKITTDNSHTREFKNNGQFIKTGITVFVPEIFNIKLIRFI